MCKNVQLPKRMALLKLLVDRGVVHATGEPEGRRMIAVGGEVLTTLLDHNVSGMPERVLRQFEGVEGAGAGPSSGVGAGAGADAGAGGGEKKREDAEFAGAVVLDAGERSSGARCRWCSRCRCRTARIPWCVAPFPVSTWRRLPICAVPGLVLTFMFPRADFDEHVHTPKGRPQDETLP